MDDFQGGGWDELGGYDDFSGNPDPGLPGDDLIFLAMFDEEESRQRAGYGRDASQAAGCCGCALPVTMALLAAVATAILAR